MFVVLSVVLSAQFSWADEFNLAEIFKDKKVKIEGNNMEMMSFLSQKLSQLKITHFSTDSIVKSLNEQARSQTGTTASEIQIGNQLVGDYTVGVEGTSPVALKIVNNATAELQTARYANAEAFMKAFNSNGGSGSSSTKINIRCPGLDHCFKKRPICRIESNKNFNSVGGYRFYIKHGDNIAYKTDTIDNAVASLNQLASSRICVKEPFITYSCKVESNPTFDTVGGYRFFIMHGENLVYKTDILDNAVSCKDQLVSAGLCYDLYGDDDQASLSAPKGWMQTLFGGKSNRDSQISELPAKKTPAGTTQGEQRAPAVGPDRSKGAL